MNIMESSFDKIFKVMELDYVFHDKIFLKLRGSYLLKELADPHECFRKVKVFDKPLLELKNEPFVSEITGENPSEKKVARRKSS